VAAAGSAELTQPGLRLRGPLAQRSGKSGRAPIVDLAGDPARQRQKRGEEALLRFLHGQRGRNPYHRYAPEQAFAADRDRDAGCLGIDLTVLQCVALCADVAQKRRQAAFVVTVFGR